MPPESFGVVVEWNTTQLAEFERNPHGELGRTLMRAIGEIVTEGAKRRALKRTGRMAAEITFEVGADETGVYTDVLSPALNPVDNFPYPIMHERKKPRDRRPHRSLVPALQDVKKLPGML
jgi:hypothetical protein